MNVWSRSFLGLVVIFAVSIAGGPKQVFADGNAKLKIKAFQVLGSKEAKASFPKALAPYKRNLTLTGLNSFKIAQTKTLSLTEGKVVTLPLTSGLGHAKLTLRSDQKILLVVKHGKQESRFVVPVPTVFANEKIKTKAGKQFFLILEKSK